MSTLKTVTILHPSSAVNNIVNDASGNVAVGNNLTVAGTAALTGATTVGGVAVVAVAPSTNGNVLTSNGTAWTSAAPSGGGLPTPSAVGQIPFSTNGSTYAATQKIVQGTAQASTSGTSIDFTSIPSWVKRITIMLNGVSLNTSSTLLFRIGSGSVISTGYSGSWGYYGGGTNAAVAATEATGFGVATGTDPIFGNSVITLIENNTWVYSSTNARFANNFTFSGAGAISLSGALDRIRMTTTGGTATFNAGSINILYE